MSFTQHRYHQSEIIFYLSTVEERAASYCVLHSSAPPSTKYYSLLRRWPPNAYECLTSCIDILRWVLLFVMGDSSVEMPMRDLTSLLLWVLYCYCSFYLATIISFVFRCMFVMNFYGLMPYIRLFSKSFNILMTDALSKLLRYALMRHPCNKSFTSIMNVRIWETRKPSTENKRCVEWKTIIK